MHGFDFLQVEQHTFLRIPKAWLGFCAPKMAFLVTDGPHFSKEPTSNNGVSCDESFIQGIQSLLLMMWCMQGCEQTTVTVGRWSCDRWPTCFKCCISCEEFGLGQAVVRWYAVWVKSNEGTRCHQVCASSCRIRSAALILMFSKKLSQPSHEQFPAGRAQACTAVGQEQRLAKWPVEP